jgi:hypothetical protein
MFIEKRNSIIKTFMFQTGQNENMLFIICGRDIRYRKLQPDKDLSVALQDGEYSFVDKKVKQGDG